MAETPKQDAPTKAPRYGKGSKFVGKKGRSGHPVRHGLTTGKLPANCRYVEHQLNAFRRTLEQAVLNVKGEVDLLDASAIQTACKWERHGALALRWLRLEGAGLKPLERLQFSREIAKASTERDRALALLGLDAPPKAPWLIEAECKP